MPYHRQVGNLPASTLLLFTPGDAAHAAKVMTERDPEHVYEALPRMMGYEGPDRGVVVRSKAEWNGMQRRFIRWLTQNEMLALCADRPIVHQTEARNS